MMSNSGIDIFAVSIYDIGEIWRNERSLPVGGSVSFRFFLLIRLFWRYFMHKIISSLEENPVVAAIGDSKWEAALESPSQVIFYRSR